MPWWQLDYREPPSPGEVKWIWELGRARHLVVLARASHCGEPRALERLEAELAGFLDQNPVERGVHWWASLELALRVVRWLEILGLAPDLNEALSDRIRRYLRAVGHHLLLEIPHTLSTMRNNHLLAHALGLLAVGVSLPHDKLARRCLRAGRRLWSRQLRHEMRPDGSTIEDSLCYDRFVAEMLATRLLIDPEPETREALVSLTQFLCRLGALDGPLPLFGDWDDGRFLTSTSDPYDLEGTVRLGLSLGGSGAPPTWRDRHDECAWYARAGLPLDPEPAVTDGHDAGGGMARAAAGNLRVWVKAGWSWSHGHADLGAVWLRDGERWVLSDPGTGTYNGPAEQRNWFRGSIAHNVLRIDRLDQIETHRAFRWRGGASARLDPPETIPGGGIRIRCTHDAYARIGCEVVRTVEVDAGGIEVSDLVIGGDGRLWALSLPLAPEACWEDGWIRIGPRRWRVKLPGAHTFHRGEHAPFDGWWSRHFEQIEPATRVEAIGVLRGPVEWSVRSAA